MGGVTGAEREALRAEWEENSSGGGDAWKMKNGAVCGVGLNCSRETASLMQILNPGGIAIKNTLDCIRTS
jgi:hypothetical protein